MSASKRKANWARKIDEPNRRCYRKFNIGDTAWFMMENKLRKGKVVQVLEAVSSMAVYTIDHWMFKEDKVFQTRQACINSLYVEFQEIMTKKSTEDNLAEFLELHSIEGDEGRMAWLTGPYYDLLVKKSQEEDDKVVLQYIWSSMGWVNALKNYGIEDLTEEDWRDSREHYEGLINE